MVTGDGAYDDEHVVVGVAGADDETVGSNVATDDGVGENISSNDVSSYAASSWKGKSSNFKSSKSSTFD